MVKSVVRPTSGSKANQVEANPLTHLPGNTRGSTPGENPPGWTHAVKLDTDPKTGKRLSNWVRGHLLNEHLHGPGRKWNLVPITKKTNKDMESSVERQAKSAIRKKGNVIFYKSSVSFHSGKWPVSSFPASINVTWGFLKRIPGSDPPRFKPSGSPKSKPFNQAAPPTTAAGVEYNINNNSIRTK